MARKRSSHGRGRGKKEKKVFPQVVGRVQMTREGYAFVIVEGEEDDVFVKASKTRGALHGDTVRVSVTREKMDRQRREGEIVEIIQRSPKPFIGILHIVANQAWVLMQSRFMPYDITIPFTESDKERYRRQKVRNRSVEEQKDETGYLKPLGDDMYAIHRVFELGEDGYGKQEMKVRSGMKVAAVVDDWPRHEMSPRGHIVDVLGEPGENDTEMHAILAEYALPYRFESAVANAADQISEEITAEDIAARRDFRDVLTFTIDPADAKDFDDALSFRKLENGNYEVGVHIADVTHYVRPGSVVDEEARSRGTSVYLVDRTVPMLPEKLCNKLCSLRPHEEKLTFSAVFEITPLARIAGQWFGKTVIYSDHRFAYEEAQAIIEAGPKAVHEGVSEEIKEAVLILNNLASKIRKKRFASGAISFDRPEMKVEVDEKGKISLGLKQTTENPWNTIQEQFPVGARVAGKVVNLAAYGAFIEIAPGVEGLIHVSEMSWNQHLRSAQDFMKVGEEVEAVILTLDRDERKMSLGIKQLKEDPWASIEEKYPIGSKHTAKVRNFTNFGIFVEIEEGVDGLIHISDLSWTKKVKHPSEFTQIGEAIEVQVLEIDKENRRLSLGHKQLEENPWDVFETVFTVGSIHEGVITELIDKGAVVSLPYGVEGFATPKHLVKEDGTQAAAEEKLSFKVIEFNKEAKRIILSHSRIFEDAAKEEEKAEKKAAAAARKSKKAEEAAPAIQNQAASTTLGDIDALAALKSKLEGKGE